MAGKFTALEPQDTKLDYEIALLYSTIDYALHMRRHRSVDQGEAITRLASSIGHELALLQRRLPQLLPEDESRFRRLALRRLQMLRAQLHHVIQPSK
jgi:hypothetical protein